MKIGVDIDDVLFDFINPFLGWVNENHGYDIKKEQIRNYNLEKVMDNPHDLINEFYKSRQFKDLQPMAGAYKTLNNDNEYYAVTARPVKTMDETLSHIYNNYPNIFEDVIMGSDNKGKLARSMNIELLIDDSMKNIYDCNTNNVQSLLYSQPWNREVFMPLSSVRVNSWKGIDKWINLYT